MLELFRGRLKVPIRTYREAIQGRMRTRAHPRENGSYFPVFARTGAVRAKVPVVDPMGLLLACCVAE